jgi:uncharacterized protein (DUF736 family)
MTQYDNNNSGALFKNDKKTLEKHPDYRGEAEVNGQKYYVSAWIKTAKSGSKFMSLSYTPKDETAQSKTKAAPVVEEIDDNIPF